MNIAQTAAEMLKSKLGLDIDVTQVAEQITNLLPSNGGDLDLSSIVGLFTSNGGALAAAASSFLGDGANDSISASSIMDMLGEGKVADFASSLGLSSESAAEGLSQVIPEVINKASDGGSLVDDITSKLGGGILDKLF